MGEVDHTLHDDTHHRWLVVIAAHGADGAERVLEKIRFHNYTSPPSPKEMLFEHPTNHQQTPHNLVFLYQSHNQLRQKSLISGVWKLNHCMMV